MPEHGCFGTRDLTKTNNIMEEMLGQQHTVQQCDWQWDWTKHVLTLTPSCSFTVSEGCARLSLVLQHRHGDGEPWHVARRWSAWSRGERSRSTGSSWSQWATLSWHPECGGHSTGGGGREGGRDEERGGRGEGGGRGEEEREKGEREGRG